MAYSLARRSSSLHGAAVRLADPFEVALVDTDMLGLNGEDLAQQMRADSQLARTRVLMMTSPNFDRTTARGDERGCSASVTKPIMESSLREALELALDKTKPLNQPGNNLKPAATVAALAGARTLVAEDVESNREVAAAILSKLGYHADLVSNGTEAIAALQSFPYDLVLMDCEMPEMDGYEATRRIRQHESLEGKTHIHLPILALTAHAISGDKSKCQDAGMDDYISKSIEPERLAEAIEKWLSTSASPVQLEARESEPGKSCQEIFNEEELLGRLMGDRTLAAKIITGFLRDAPIQLRHLGERLQAGDAEESRRRAHGLKGLPLPFRRQISATRPCKWKRLHVPAN